MVWKKKDFVYHRKECCVDKYKNVFNRKTKLDNEISHMNFHTNISKYYRWKHQDSWGNIISNCTVLLLQIWKHFADLIQRLIEKNFQKAVFGFF